MHSVNLFTMLSTNSGMSDISAPFIPRCWKTYLHHSSELKRVMVYEMFQQNAFKFAIIIWIIKTHLVAFFPFLLYVLYFSSPNECPVDIDQDINEGRGRGSSRNWKMKTNHTGFHRYSKYWTNFEAFHWNISWNINILFLKSFVWILELGRSDLSSRLESKKVI